MATLDLDNDGECEYDELQVALCHMMENNDHETAQSTTEEACSGKVVLMELLLFLMAVNNICMDNGFKVLFEQHDKDSDGSISEFHLFHLFHLFTYNFAQWCV